MCAPPLTFLYTSSCWHIEVHVSEIESAKQFLMQNGLHYATEPRNDSHSVGGMPSASRVFSSPPSAPYGNYREPPGSTSRAASSTRSSSRKHAFQDIVFSDSDDDDDDSFVCDDAKPSAAPGTSVQDRIVFSPDSPSTTGLINPLIFAIGKEQVKVAIAALIVPDTVTQVTCTQHIQGNKIIFNTFYGDASAFPLISYFCNENAKNLVENSIDEWNHSKPNGFNCTYILEAPFKLKDRFSTRIFYAPVRDKGGSIVGRKKQGYFVRKGQTKDSAGNPVSIKVLCFSVEEHREKVRGIRQKLEEELVFNLDEVELGQKRGQKRASEGENDTDEEDDDGSDTEMN